MQWENDHSNQEVDAQFRQRLTGRNLLDGGVQIDQSEFKQGQHLSIECPSHCQAKWVRVVSLMFSFPALRRPNVG